MRFAQFQQTLDHKVNFKEIPVPDKKYLNVGCGHHYAAGWINTDVREDEKTRPDVVVGRDESYPFEDNYFDAIYLGHVLEHISWNKIGVFLKEMVRVAKPGAPVLAVGPDVYRTIQRWKEGKEPWDMVKSVMEHQDIDAQLYHAADDGSYVAYPPPTPEWWDGAAHYWNCHEDRLKKVMETHFGEVQIYSSFIESDLPGNRQTWHDSTNNITWPVVGYWWWQCAVAGKVNK
jgi:SAM-dependent methyltransferase